ncbi:hypothetical protein HPB48_000948 [Haemaphysalis longicornis]|uniref:Uncharacterized protein n=1 Tax=Haemaphysalis longicornis TaxID=44386 RepID=A0A9J6GJY2_HAELO|nr:hypothetical protein HPB48_000948 [Haemaphysalis longicornis]
MPNKWLKTNDHCYWFPALKTGPRKMLYAYFKIIKAAHDLEWDQLLRYWYTMCRRGVSSSETENNNVQVALQVFSDSGPTTLRVIRAKHQLKHIEETASFRETILNRLEIINVKTPFKGVCFRDDFKKPMFLSEKDPKVPFLYDFLDWLECWKEKQADTCKLTKHTLGALRQTTGALIEIGRYCFDELLMSFILLGKFQTSLLEERFTRYRRPSGSQYHVFIRKVYKGETKLRHQNGLPQIGTS